MGVDWVPARPRLGVDVDELRELIGAQARRVRRSLVGDDIPESYRHPGGTGAVPLDLPDLDGKLLARLDIPSENGSWPSFRVNVIAHHPLFPPEWRYEACSTFLPADARRTVARWQWWYGEIVAGRMRHYLRRLTIHETSRRLEGTQARLLERVRAAMTRTNAWAHTERFRRACAQAHALPTPPGTAPVGVPPAAETDDASAPDQDQQSRALVYHIGLVNDAVGMFNRSVPAAFKTSRPQPLPPPHPPNDPWIEDFFSWVAPPLRAGYGLYLWA